MAIVVRNVRLRGQQGIVDIVVEKDRIASVQPKAAGEGHYEINAGGSRVLSGMFNLHHHADKSLLGEICG
jgi:cytosine/adenosine deaminase-related metal-dependent hydrolase